MYNRLKQIFFVSPISSTVAYKISTLINNLPVSFVLDTGAAVTILHRETWEKIKMPKSQLTTWTGQNLIGVEGTPLQVLGCSEIPVEIEGKTFSMKVIVVSSLTAEAIMGMDFLEANNCKIDLKQKALCFPDRNLCVPLKNSLADMTTEASVVVMLEEPLHLAPLSEIEIMAKVSGECKGEGTWLLEESKSQRLPVRVAHAIVCPNSSIVPVRLLNPRPETVTVYKNTQLAVLEKLEATPPQVKLPVSLVHAESVIPQQKREMLWQIVERCGSGLNDEQKQAFFLLLTAYADVFAMTKEDMGRTGKLRHSVFTGSAAPVRQQVQQIPPHKKEEVHNLVEEMLHNDVIKPSTSPWASPVVLVRKKDESTRMCIDYRKLNAVTRKDAYPLPRIDDALDALSGSKWFSTLDLISGYWQVEMDKTDQEKTAFCNSEGLFEFKVMPFGLCNAPATFQRLMDLVLAGLQWSTCLVYLDDIIIIGRTFEDHLQQIKAVERLKEAGLKLQPPKCCFFQKKVQYLGHIVSEDGIATDPSKVGKVAQWPTPSTAREVQQFLGLAGYYRRFIQNFSAIAKPLHKLTEWTSNFNWTNDCETSFKQLKEKLVSAPILTFPDFGLEFVLDTDASNTGIGAELSQVQEDGSEKEIAYASRLLSRAERRYCVTRRELLAVVYFIHQFRPYLLGKQFTLRTDHGSLTWLMNFKEPEGQLARWLEKLQEYDMKIVHRRGRKHSNADAMSRLPCQQCGRESHIITILQVLKKRYRFQLSK